MHKPWPHIVEYVKHVYVSFQYTFYSLSVGVSLLKYGYLGANDSSPRTDSVSSASRILTAPNILVASVGDNKSEERNENPNNS